MSRTYPDTLDRKKEPIRKPSELARIARDLIAVDKAITLLAEFGIAVPISKAVIIESVISSKEGCALPY